MEYLQQAMETLPMKCPNPDCDGKLKETREDYWLVLICDECGFYEDISGPGVKAK